MRCLALLPLLLLLPLTVHCSEMVDKQDVLIIHSYHKEMQWVDEIEEAIENRLVSARGTAVDIKVEYMDTKRHVEPEYYRLLLEVWRHKYRNRQPEVIIVSDDNALNFVLSIREQLFPNTPLVFCGVNHYDPERFASIGSITGVVEAYDLAGTFDLIKQLLPDYRDLFIVNDHTLTGQANKARIEEIAYQYAGTFNFTYSGNLSIETLASVVRSLPDRTAILLMSYNLDDEGRTFRYRDAIKAIRHSSNQPIFGVWSFYLGRGIVGGSLVNGESQGVKAAELALQILDGTDASSLPVIKESPNLPMFDYHELKRFNIPVSVLPKDSTVINSPDSIWHRHRATILTAMLLVLAQFGIITLLLKNIRKRKDSELTLRKNQQKLATTLEAIGEAVITIDQHFKVASANAQAAKLLAVEPEKIHARSLPELLVELDPKDGHLLVEAIRACHTSKSRQEFAEETVFSPAGHPPQHLSGSIAPISTSDGQFLGSVLVCHDISEKLSMQNMLAQSRKMEAIGQLAGGVAHDFNNLLTGISGFAELLTIQLPANSQENQNARRILQAASRAADLTRKLLSFARKGRIISSPVDLHQSLQSAVDLLQRSIDRAIIMSARLNAKRSVIIGDPTQLENLFLNLGINSADAMPDGGTITITTDNVEIAEPEPCESGEILEPGAYLRVSFRDTGCGIEERLRERIFEPFFTTKEQGKGTGLGLAAVFGAMKEHRGQIKLNTVEGQGTEFLLYFPLSQFAITEPQTLPELHDGHGATVLVIDDERIILATAEALLTELGYQVLVAEGALAGIETYRRLYQEIDVVLLDMIMPEMNGTSCLKELRSINSCVKAIICSGFTNTERFAEAESLGVRGFLAKPYTAAELSRAIHPVLKG